MKRKNLLMAVCTVLATVALAATLGGCAPSQPSGDAGNGGADAASYPVGSLKAVRVAGQLDDADEYPNKLCLSCHDRTTINAANEDFGGIEGFNPPATRLTARRPSPATSATTRRCPRAGRAPSAAPARSTA